MDVCRRCSCAIVNILIYTQAEGLYYQGYCSNGNEHSTFKQKGISPAASCVVYRDVLRQSWLGMFVASIFSFSECLNSAFQLTLFDRLYKLCWETWCARGPFMLEIAPHKREQHGASASSQVSFLFFYKVHKTGNLQTDSKAYLAWLTLKKKSN